MKNPFGPNNWLPNLIKLAWIGVNIYLFVSSYLKYANGEGIFYFQFFNPRNRPTSLKYFLNE